ncbi:MAG: hypothetical protein GYA31_00980, partial [Parcubacteria group bacterium]|nr:hypothetical protein [Parcubacteria group bacterium]
ALAGFGISPPYVKNDNLFRGSVYEKIITITRGDPTEDLKAEITIDVPGANDWITINRGKEFILPKGEKKIPIVVTVKIPKDAPYGNYKGGIRIKTSSLEALQKGSVSIALGAYIDVNLNVTKAKIFDFLIRGMKMFDTEEGFTKWIFHFPTKIKAELQLENLGNIKCHPTKVLLDIYDENKINVLKTLEANKMTSVKPFETGGVLITFLTDLKPGSYYVHYKIYKNQEIAPGGEGDLHLSIVPHGTIPGYQGATIFDLPLGEKLIILTPVLIVLGLLGFGIFKLITKITKK